jgi:uncharacterized repeat protein (TIGR04052 family)
VSCRSRGATHAPAIASIAERQRHSSIDFLGASNMTRRSVAFATMTLCALSTATLAITACSDDATSPATSADAASPPVPTSTIDAAPPPVADSGTDTTPAPLDVSIDFAARVGALPAACGTTYDNLGTSAASVKLADFRFYLHAVALVRADGVSVPVVLTQDAKWQYDDVALLDFENGADDCAGDGTVDMNTAVKGRVPAGAYKGLTFVLGVPFARNHANQATAPSPLNLGKLFWSWNSGYRFAKIESKPQGTDMGGDAYGPFLFHLGSTACEGDAADGGAVTGCGKPNRLPVSLPLYELGKSKVVFDYAALVSGSDLLVNGGGPPGCMSFPGDPECSVVFEHLGLDYATGAPTTTPGSAFKLE